MRGPDDLEAPFLELHLDVVPHHRLSLWDHRPEIDNRVNPLGFEALVVDWGSDASQIPKLRAVVYSMHRRLSEELNSRG